MAHQEQNFWLTTTALPRTNLRSLPEFVDIAVIGAGFTGLSAARTLAKRGARVAVLEGESIGWGASSRNDADQFHHPPRNSQKSPKAARIARPAVEAAAVNSADTSETGIHQKIGNTSR